MYISHDVIAASAKHLRKFCRYFKDACKSVKCFNRISLKERVKGIRHPKSVLSSLVHIRKALLLPLQNIFENSSDILKMHVNL